MGIRMRSAAWLAGVAVIVGSFCAVGPVVANEASQCSMCLYVFDKSEKAVAKAKAEGRLDEKTMSTILAETCDKAGGDARDICKDYVATNGKALTVAAKRGLSRPDTCHHVGLCMSY